MRFETSKCGADRRVIDVNWKRNATEEVCGCMGLGGWFVGAETHTQGQRFNTKKLVINERMDDYIRQIEFRLGNRILVKFFFCCWCYFVETTGIDRVFRRVVGEWND